MLDYGDFQTPLPLARQCMQVIGGKWARVLEPTCGLGSFLQAAIETQDADVVGMEIQPKHVEVALTTGARVIEQDIFVADLIQIPAWTREGPLLVVGNPPWVTNADLGRMGSTNRPERMNFKNMSGFDAMTGASNFDITEYIWIKLIVQLQSENPTISMLCKTQVARNVLSFCAQAQLPIASASIHLINAKKWFGVMTDACLFTVNVGSGNSYQANVYQALQDTQPTHRVGVVGGKLVADVDDYLRHEAIDGLSPVQWRQGLKHDAAAVMELAENNGPCSRDGVLVDIEPEYLLPFIKCTALYHGQVSEIGRWVVVPQRRLGEETDKLKSEAPKLWKYLNDNGDALDARKSSIYNNRPRFSVFGIGDYTFAPYKVAISGLHKKPSFRIVGPLVGQPTILDDTCYFLACDSAEDASLFYALITTQIALDLVTGIMFPDAKRPITKKLLQRVDLAAILDLSDHDALVSAAMEASKEYGLDVKKEDLARRLPVLFVRHEDRPALVSKDAVRTHRKELQVVREWARAAGMPISDQGRIPTSIQHAFRRAQLDTDDVETQVNTLF
jgi:hypothetical protein